MNSASKWTIGIVVLIMLVVAIVLISNSGDTIQSDSQTQGVDTSDIQSQSGEELIDNSIIGEDDDVELGEVI